MRTRLLLSATVVLLGFSIAMYVTLGKHNGRTAPDIAGLLWPDPPVLGPFTLLDVDGKPFTKQEFLGHWTLVFFGFTNCPDICPTTLSTLNQVYEQMRGNADLFSRLQVLFVSVDPERDSSDILRSYIHYFNNAFIGATADKENLQRLTRQFGVLFLKVEIPGETSYSMDHSGSILLVDPNARFVGLFSLPHVASDIADRLERMVSFLEAAEG